MIVAKLTGWGLSDLLALTVEELIAWHQAADKVKREIAANVRKG